MEDKELTFHDITDGSAFIPQSLPLYVWVLIGILGVALIIFSILFFRRKKPLSISNESSVKNALKKLKSQEESILTAEIPAAATHLSLIMREALGETQNADSIYQSQQEFHKVDYSSLPADVIQHLNTLWSLEYAPPNQNNGDVNNLLEQTRELLNRLPKETSSQST